MHSQLRIFDNIGRIFVFEIISIISNGYYILETSVKQKYFDEDYFQFLNKFYERYNLYGYCDKNLYQIVDSIILLENFVNEKRLSCSEILDLKLEPNLTFESNIENENMKIFFEFKQLIKLG